MSIIKNRQKLALTTERQTILEIIEAGLQAIQPARVMTENFKLENQQLRVVDKQFDLSKYQRIFLIGFGKGSAVQAELMADRLGNFLTEGWVIDVDGSNRRPNEKIHFTTGTHPLPSQQNFDFSKSVVEKLNQLTGSDLALVIVGGGGSALLTYPTVELEQKIALTQKLLRSGASITEMNTLRKHLSLVKGGGLAKVLYPATVVGLIFSDVPGNDLSVVASLIASTKARILLPSTSITCQLKALYLSASGSSGITFSVKPSIWILFLSIITVKLLTLYFAANITASHVLPS